MQLVSYKYLRQQGMHGLFHMHYKRMLLHCLGQIVLQGYSTFLFLPNPLLPLLSAHFPATFVLH